MKKRLLSIVLIAAMLLPALAGNAFAESADAGTAVPADEKWEGQLPLVDEPITLTVFTHQGVNASYPPPSNDLPFWQYMEKLTNVHIEWETVPSDGLAEIVSTRLAAGTDLPDLINLSSNDLSSTAGNNGLVINMAPLLENNGYYLQKLFEEHPVYKTLFSVGDGEMYSIASTVGPDRNQPTLIYRKAWLDQVGEEVPTTTEDFERVLKKMMEVDFNGNGKADEIGLTSFDYVGLTSMSTSFGLEGLENENYFVADENGVVTDDYTSDRMKEWLMYLNHLYEEGILDPQLFSTDWNTLYENIAADRVACCMIYSTFSPDFAAMVPEGADDPYKEIWTVGGPLEGPHGDQFMILREKTAGDNMGITKDCKNPEIAMRWLDVLYAMPEVQETRYWGEEGVTYEVDENGERHRIIPEGKTWSDQINSYFGGGQIPMPHQQVEDLWLLNYDDVPELSWWVEEDKALIPYMRSSSVPLVTLTYDEQEIKDMYFTDLNTYFEESRANFVTGKTSFDEWDNYVATMNSLGLQELTEVYQSVYDRTR